MKRILFANLYLLLATIVILVFAFAFGKFAGAFAFVSMIVFTACYQEKIFEGK